MTAAFTDKKKITKSHIPTKNTPARIDILEEQPVSTSKVRLKRGSPVDSKDKIFLKEKTLKVYTPKEDKFLKSTVEEKITN